MRTKHLLSTPLLAERVIPVALSSGKWDLKVTCVNNFDNNFSGGYEADGASWPSVARSGNVLRKASGFPAPRPLQTMMLASWALVFLGT